MPAAFNAEIAPNAEALAGAVRQLCAWLAAAGAPAAALWRVELVLEEVVMNVIMHGHPPDGAAPRIALAAALEGEGCRLSVTDNGPAFDPATAPPARDAASLDQEHPGGLGLLLLRRYGRNLAWRHLPEGNRLDVTVPLTET